MQNALIIMVKNPVAGKVKTRLAADIGNSAALNVYNQLLQHTQQVAKAVNCHRFVFYSDVVERTDLFDSTDFKKYTQCSGDLGIRMDYAFSIPFKNEYKKVVMIGSDCYGLHASHVTEAFNALDQHDFVLGPAEDGGYYLIGMKKWHRWIFQNKQWSTHHLLVETQQDISVKQHSLYTLETLSDVDTLKDAQKYSELLINQ